VLLAAFEREGIDLRLSTKLTRVESDNGVCRAVVDQAGKEVSIEFDRILVAVGRSPNVKGLGLERVGVEYDVERGVHVDDFLRTKNPTIFAAGDICMRHKFTHAADFAARAVIQNALFFGRKRLSALTIPWCTYTDPEIAHVGRSERDELNSGVAMQTYVREFSDVDRAIAEGRTEGFVKIHVEKGKDRIPGATIVGPHAGDLISEVGVAMAGKLGLGALSSVIHPYPTLAEAIRQTGDAHNRTRLTPMVKRLFERILAFRR
jgi:pyruvate/2-oxoglutarate dehydrogenase complex dihydrolipoamide dehydrogenase (E3) component